MKRKTFLNWNELEEKLDWDKSNSQLARELGCAANTVRAHRPADKATAGLKAPRTRMDNVCAAKLGATLISDPVMCQTPDFLERLHKNHEWTRDIPDGSILRLRKSLGLEPKKTRDDLADVYQKLSDLETMIHDLACFMDRGGV